MISKELLHDQIMKVPISVYCTHFHLVLTTIFLSLCCIRNDKFTLKGKICENKMQRVFRYSYNICKFPIFQNRLNSVKLTLILINFTKFFKKVRLRFDFSVFSRETNVLIKYFCGVMHI